MELWSWPPTNPGQDLGPADTGEGGPEKLWAGKQVSRDLSALGPFGAEANFLSGHAPKPALPPAKPGQKAGDLTHLTATLQPAWLEQ